MNKRSEVDWPTVLKLLAGGGLVGAGLGAGTSLMRYLGTLKQKADEAKDTSYDDDVLYINVPRNQPMANRRAQSAPKWASEKSATNPNTVGTFTVGTLAGLLGTYLGYSGVRSLYQKARKKQLQGELDSAQNIYLGNLGTQADLQKNASTFGVMTKGVGSGYLVGLLGALGTGIVAHRMLQKYFPPLKSPNRGKPRKIVLRTADNNPDKEKTIEGKVTPDAVEHLVRTNMANPKSASVDCELYDLVHAAAQGRCTEIKDNIKDFGLDFALDAVKGARHVKVSSVNLNLAINWASADPMVSEAIQPMLASEFADMAPGFFKQACNVEDRYHDALVGMVEAITQDVRQAIYSPLIGPVTKEAGAAAAALVGGDLLQSMMLSDSLRNFLEAGGRGGGGEGEDAVGSDDVRQTPSNVSTPISKDSPDMAQYRKGLNTYEIADSDAKRFTEQHGQAIDNTLRRM